MTILSPKKNDGVPHWSKAGSFLLTHLDFSAYLSILSLASTLTILKPSSTSMMESTLQNETQYKFSVKMAANNNFEMLSSLDFIDFMEFLKKYL